MREQRSADAWPLISRYRHATVALRSRYGRSTVALRSLHRYAAFPELCFADEGVEKNGFAFLVMELLRLPKLGSHIVAPAHLQPLCAEPFHDLVVASILRGGDTKTRLRVTLSVVLKRFKRGIKAGLIVEIKRVYVWY